MADGPNQFEVEFTTTSDPSGAEETSAALKEVTENAEAANAAVSAGAGNSSADFAVQLEREKSLREAMLSTEQEATAEQQKQIEAEERRQSLLSQRTAMAEQQLAAIRAEAAGENETAAALQREVEIRRIALQLQQATTLSEEEATALATQRVADEELITAEKAAQAELNATLVSEEAAQNYERLARAAQGFAERAALGVSSTRSLMGLLNAFPPQIALAGAAAFGIYEALNHAAEAQKKLSVETEKTSQMLRDQANAALEVSDSDSKTIQAALEKQAAAVKRTRDEIGLAFAAGDKKRAEGLEQVIGQEKVYLEFLQRRLEVAKDLEQQEAVAAENHQQAAAAQKAYEDAAEAADALKSKLHEIDLGELDPDKRVDVLGDDLDKVGEKLRALGSDAKTPDEALAQLSSYPTEVQAKMVPLIQRWADLEKAEISAGNAAQKAAEQAAKDETDYQLSLEKTINDLKAKAEALGLTVKTPAAKPTATSADETELQKAIAQRDAQTDPQNYANYDAIVQTIQTRIQTAIQAQIDAAAKALQDSATKPAPAGPRGNVTDQELQRRQQDNEKQLEDEAQKVEDASKTTGEKTAQSLNSAATNFNQLPPHFDTFRETIQQGTEAIAAKATDVTNGMQSLSDTTVAGFKSILQIMADQQKQITNLAGQIANLS